MSVYMNICVLLRLRIPTQICPFSKSKFNLYEASTLLHRLVLFIELGTVQTAARKVDPARKFKCTTPSCVPTSSSSINPGN